MISNHIGGRLSDRTLGAVAAGVILLFLVLVVTGALRGLLTNDGDRVIRARFSDTRQLTKGAPVRIDGVKVGEVEALRLDENGRTSTVTLRLTDDTGPLYRDARAGIRFRTLLGGNFVVELQRGTPSAGDLADGTIPAARTSDQVELDDITSLVRGRALDGLRTLPDELARTLRDPMTPTAALEVVAKNATSLERGLRAARGQDPDDDLATLVDSTARTVRALDRPGSRLQKTIAGTAALLQTTAQRQAELRATLADAPGLLQRTDVTLAALRRTLGIANPVLQKVRTPAGDVAPTVAQLRGTIVPADRLAGDAVPLLRSLRPAVRSLVSASREGVPLLNALAPSLERLDKTILPQTAEDQPDTGMSTSELIGPAAAGLSAIGAYVDDAGRQVRFPATSGNNAFYLPCQTYLNDPSQQQVLLCESLTKAARTLLASRRGKP
jgi:phospholipid/cholesterol/gamma-HCH transport system substrate-binding protein